MKTFKTIVLLIFCSALFLMLSGCDNTKSLPADNFAWDTKLVVEPAFSEPIVAVWISYLDMLDIFSSGFAIDDVIANLCSIGVTDVYLQVTAFGEALWKSNVYPSACLTVYKGCEVPDSFLTDFIEVAGCSRIKVHAWLNPYRLYSGTNDEYQDFVSTLEAKDLVRWHNSSPYLNPASDHTIRLITDAIDELVTIGFAGIHLDDYFYPTTDEEFDKADYETYQLNGGDLGLNDYRRENVNRLVRACYNKVKEHYDNMVFGISPDGSLERDYEQHYCDVELWCREEGYIDYICPQIYYGFDNDTLPFSKTLEQWERVSGQKPLIVGLAFSKVGREDVFAGSGIDEWQNNSDMIAKQAVTVSQNSNTDGIALFRYGSLFRPSEDVAELVSLEISNLESVLEE